MSGRNNQKVNFNLRRWNTVVGFRADSDTHSHRMPRLHMHACQAIMRILSLQKNTCEEKISCQATVYSCEK